MNNILLNTDSYKLSHFLQYPPNTEKMYSYIESRGVDERASLYKSGEKPTTLFFGLQAFLREYLVKGFTLKDIYAAEQIATAHGLPFNKEGWLYLLGKYGGKFPVTIKAVHEGTVVPTHNVLVTVENDDPKVPWLTAYLETAILRAIWYPTTVATNSYLIKKDIEKYLNETGDPTGLGFKLHDFGARGVSSYESAAIGGAAHLVNFMGTDTLAGIEFLNQYYKTYGQMPAFSIPAAEHSTITSWDDEADAMENMIDQFAGEGKLVAIVSDSYDLWNAIDNIFGDKLRDKVINNGGTIVVRPDSGNPTQIVLNTIKHLMNKFGYTTNDKGYTVLPDYIRVIQGDGINRATINNILETLKVYGISADNIAFGMGGALLQEVSRDTFKFAMKASATYRDGKWHDVFKNPVTGGGKASKAGRQVLLRDGKGFYTQKMTESNKDADLLRTVFTKGKILLSEEESIFNIRKRAETF